MTKPTSLSPAEIADRLQTLPAWRFEGGALMREYQTDGWPTTLMLVNAIGFFAEAADHHPDLAVSWGKVGVKLRSEEHTSELQSLRHLVCRLLLEKKNTKSS